MAAGQWRAPHAGLAGTFAPRPGERWFLRMVFWPFEQYHNWKAERWAARQLQYANQLDRAAKFLTRAGALVTAADGAWTQWKSDRGRDDLNTGEKVVRATVRGAGSEAWRSSDCTGSGKRRRGGPGERAPKASRAP